MTETKSNITDFVFTNAVFSDSTKWGGGVSYAINEKSAVEKIFGKIIHKTSAAPEWGEIVCTIPGFNRSYSCPIPVYSNRGNVYNAFVLLDSGRICVYGSDMDNLIYAGEEFTFSISF